MARLSAPAAMLVQSRGIHEGDLCVRQMRDPDDSMPGGLRSWRHDAELLPDHRIEQR